MEGKSKMTKGDGVSKDQEKEKRWLGKRRRMLQKPQQPFEEFLSTKRSNHVRVGNGGNRVNRHQARTCPKKKMRKSKMSSKRDQSKREKERKRKRGGEEGGKEYPPGEDPGLCDKQTADRPG